MVTDEIRFYVYDIIACICRNNFLFSREICQGFQNRYQSREKIFFNDHEIKPKVKNNSSEFREKMVLNILLATCLDRNDC